ncbi:peptidase family M1-domain-containing protein [Apodospora peruviana]|uniref:Peptidase family M1-domain-containing protein n=1 Tax=Apodospora peruviana TaxID=516989 RepID=A0AAE0MBQ9_9PEZI|nr:peptidase family M1-domain-containing protein [Apodospora peruviana]
MWGFLRFGRARSVAQETIAKSIPTIPSTRRCFSLGAAKMAGLRDPNTLSNYDAWRTKHTTANLKVDFEDKCLRGSVILELESQTDKASNEIILDSSYLAVDSVTLNSSPSAWEIKDRTECYGSPVHVAVPEGVAKGEIVKLEISLATTHKCTALQWLTAAQTSNQKAPFMFSQCQAIHARSLFPCQDTPDVKSTYDFNITSPYVVVASGVPLPTETEGLEGEKLYKFEQKVPIPSYLFALASGDIATAPIGKRSVVATGPNELKESQWELEADMDKFMDVAEKIVFPYQWGEYNVLVLPPSFPYGGMENPIFTFATPTIISGDRQNVDVIAHELSHSWSGNLVTSCSWEHFWLNEGWTTYLERRIQAAVHGNSAMFDFSAIIGWKALEESVEGHGKDHEFTKLLISHMGIDPDDAFSTVPYEKGFHFIYYLDRLVGRENFDKFIPFYFGKWATKSLDSYEFKATFLEFFGAPGYADLKEKIAGIDWEARFYNPGLPPKPDFDTSLVDVCYELARKWKQPGFSPSPSDISSWAGNQVLVFLNEVQGFEEPLTVEQTQAMGKAYGLAEGKNVELKEGYYQIAMRAKDASVYQGVAELLGQVGRMKFVRPLFRSLNKVDRDLALKTLERNRDFYHPICRQMVEKDLGVAGA